MLARPAAPAMLRSFRPSAPALRNALAAHAASGVAYASAPDSTVLPPASIAVASPHRCRSRRPVINAPPPASARTVHSLHLRTWYGQGALPFAALWRASPFSMACLRCRAAVLPRPAFDIVSTVIVFTFTDAGEPGGTNGTPPPDTAAYLITSGSGTVVLNVPATALTFGDQQAHAQ